MSRVSGCLWLVVGLVLALVAGGVAFVSLQRATVTKAQTVTEATVDVVVALRPVQPGATLSEGDLTLQSLPEAAVPAGALKTVAEAAGQITTVAVDVGEMILSHHLTRPDITNRNLGFTLPEGQVAVTLGADDLLSMAQVLKPGDHVDILYSVRIKVKRTALAGSNGGSGGGSEEDEEQYSFGALQNAVIVTVLGSGAVGASEASDAAPAVAGAEGGKPFAYILAIKPQDALTLKYLKDAEAVMDMAVRNIADETEHEYQPVDVEYLVDRFQLPVR